MFIAAVGGAVVVVGGAAIASHDDYSDHSRHSKYSEYGDSYLRSQISDMESRIERQKADIDSYRGKIESAFNSRIQELKCEADYESLSLTYDKILNGIKNDMKKELEIGIEKEKRQLEEINNIIARINKQEMQASR